MSLPRQNRLNLRFHRLLLTQQGITQRTPLFTFVFFPNSLPYSRYAILMSRKFSPSAVTRNHVKRSITNTLRLHLKSLPLSQDIIIIPQKKALSSSSQLSSDLIHQLQHLPLQSSSNNQSPSDNENKHSSQKNS